MNQSQNIEKAAQIVKNAGYNASFSAYSDTNGISVYFVNEDGKKIRVSAHSVTNAGRLANEIHLDFPLPTMGVARKAEYKPFVLTQEMIDAAKARKAAQAL